MKNRANPENCRALNRKYLSTPKGRAARARATRAYRARHKAKLDAHNAVAYALRTGRIEPWPVCAVPDCTEHKPQAHHPDYSAPLAVVWLCDHHHKQAHRVSEVAPQP